MEINKLIRDEELFLSIVKEFNNIPHKEIYPTHLKIALEKYCEYLTDVPISERKINTKLNILFLKKDNHKWVINEKIYNECIQKSKSEEEFIFIEFMFIKITLESLRNNLLDICD
jgi:hypothetical protein